MNKTDKDKLERAKEKWAAMLPIDVYFLKMNDVDEFEEFKKRTGITDEEYKLLRDNKDLWI